MHILATFATLCYGTQCSPNHSCTTRGQKLPILGPPPGPPQKPPFLPFFGHFAPPAPPDPPPDPPPAPLPPEKFPSAHKKTTATEKIPRRKLFPPTLRRNSPRAQILRAQIRKNAQKLKCAKHNFFWCTICKFCAHKFCTAQIKKFSDVHKKIFTYKKIL